MEMIINIQVKKHIPDEEYKNLFPNEEALAADIELFKHETMVDMMEVFPAAEEIVVSIEDINLPE